MNDPGFAGAVVGAIAGLVGAVIGGAATYVASIRQYRTEYRMKQHAALIAALLEISRNHASLFRDLDRVIPLWLARSYFERPHDLAKVSSGFARYDVRVYQNFFSELVASKYGPELKTYYDRIEYLNAVTTAHPQGIPPELFHTLVPQLALSLELTHEILEELASACAKELKQAWGKESDYQSVHNARDDALLLAAMFRTNLADLEDALAGRDAPTIATRLIDRYRQRVHDAWMAPARALLP